jgi:hypothetical protein
MAATSGSRRVVIVGGGFAGLFAPRALRRAPVQPPLWSRRRGRPAPHLGAAQRAHDSVVAVGQGADELVQVRRLRGVGQVGVAGAGAGVAQVVGDRGVEQEGVLEHHAQLAGQRGAGDLAQVARRVLVVGNHVVLTKAER